MTSNKKELPVTTEHTPAAAGLASAGMPVRERKVKPGGEVREYELTLVIRRPGLLVARFPLVAGASSPHLAADIPPGSCSDGYFWARRPYVLYRFRGPDAAPIAHRLDAVSSVHLGDSTVTYRDLVLDWWVLPDGRLVEEDGDELEALLESGVLSAADARRARNAACHVLGRYRHIMDEVADLERTAGY